MKSLFWPPGGAPKSLPEASGAEKNHGELPGGLRENFPARFHPPKGLRRPIWAPFWPPWGLLFGFFLSSGAKTSKSQKILFFQWVFNDF